MYKRQAERCKNCKSKKHVAYDELIGEEGETVESGRFDQVAQLEKRSPDERFAFWRQELSRCIRCKEMCIRDSLCAARLFDRRKV